MKPNKKGTGATFHTLNTGVLRSAQPKNMPSVPCAETRPPYWPSGAGHRRRGRTGGARVHEHVLPGAAEELGVDLSLFFSFIMISASGFKVRLGYVIQPYGRTRIIHFYFM